MENKMLTDVFANRLKHAQVDSGMSPEDFAVKKLELSPSTYRNIVTVKKERVVSYKNLLKVCAILGWDQQEFIENGNHIANGAKAEPVESTNTLYDRDSLLLSLGRAQGEASAYKNALEQQTITIREHIDSYNKKFDTVIECITKDKQTLTEIISKIKKKNSTNPGIVDSWIF